MIRMLAMLASVGLLIQAAVKLAYSQGPLQPDEYLMAGLIFGAPILSLLALVRTSGWGLFGDFVTRLRLEEQVRIEAARSTLTKTRRSSDD